MDAKDIKINNTDALGNFSSADTLERYVQQVAQGLSEVINNGGGGGRNVQVGTTTTLSAGVNATVDESPLSTAETLILDFGIPEGIQGAQGAKGDSGAAGTNAVNPIFTIGTVTLGATASVTLTGTYPNLFLNFVLVKGDTGATGPAGSAMADGLAIFEWTGNQSVPSLSEQNITTLLTETQDTVGFTKVGNSIRFDPRGATEQTNIGIRVRITGTISGSSGTDRFYQAQLRRADGTTVLENINLVKASGTNIANASAYFSTYSKGTNDPFSLNGFQVWVVSGDDGTLNMTSVNLTIYASAKP